MTTKIKTTLLLVLLVSICTYSQQKIKLGLNDVLKIALEKNVLLLQSKNNLDVSDAQIKSALGNFLPSLSASAGWSWNRTQQNAGTVSYGGVITQVDANTTDSRNYSVNLSGNWTLFDGLSSFANYYKAQSDKESYLNLLERMKQDVVFQAESKFFAVLKSQKLLLVQEQNLKWNQKSLETIQEKNKLGQIPIGDVYQQQVDYGNAELTLIQAKNNFENLKNDLVAFLMLDVASEYEFFEKESLSFDSLQIQSDGKDYQEFLKNVDLAFSKRYDYISKKLDLDSRSKDITIARSGHLPFLSGNFSASTRDDNFNNLFKSKNYSVGLTLSLPIFSGWSVSERVQYAEVNYENTKLQLSEKEKQIKIELKKSFLDFQSAQKKLDVSNKNLIAAEQNKRVYEERYNLGSGTLLNLLIANSQFVNAQTQQISSIYDYITQKQQVEYYLGILEYKIYEK